jgi:SAM-dependent methyltransferase
MVSSVPTRETARFIERWLKSTQRILEVGAGNGALAATLMQKGHEVTALDRSSGCIREAAARGLRTVCADFLSWSTDEIFDAVLFTRSLHHMPDLPRALERAEALLAPSGRLVAEEFGVDRIDRATARWFYDVCGILEAAEILPPEGESPRDPLERWQADHKEPLHGGEAMEAEIGKRFAPLGTEDAPYLYRIMCARMQDEVRSHKVAARLFEIEERAIAEGTLRPVGIRIVAQKKS